MSQLMDMKVFFNELQQRGIRILLDDSGALRVKGKKEQLDTTLVEKLKANKAEIADYLTQNPQVMPEPVELDKRRHRLSDEQTKTWVDKFNDTESERYRTDAFSDLTLHAMVEAQVVDNPNKVAVEFKDGRLSYAQLNRQANKLATFLRREGIESDSLVGICLSPGVNRVVAMLAVLKSGGAYLPICPTKASIPEGCQCDLLLTDQGLRSQFDGLTTRCHNLDDIEIKQAIDCCSPANPQVLEMQNMLSLACVLFGTGAKGDDRGVMIEHGNIITLIDSPNYVQLGAQDVVAHCGAFDSDAALFEIWGALANGATLIEIDRNLQSSPMMLKQAINLKKISVMLLPMPLFSHLVCLRPDCFAKLASLLVYGLPLDADVLNRVLNGGKPKRLVHLFGVLENTAFATFQEINDSIVPGRLGKPVTASCCYILGEDLTLMAPGKPGTLYLGGFGLARGYVGDWRETEEAFLPSPFSDDPNDHIFATTLKAQYRADGCIELTEPVAHPLSPWPQPTKPSLVKTVGQNNVKGRFYQNIWQSQPLNTLNKTALLPGACYLLLCDNYGVGNRLAQILRLQSQQVVCVRIGQRLQQLSDEQWMLNPTSESDYSALLQSLAEQGINRVEVVHLWSIAALDTLAPCEPVFEQLARFESHLDRGLQSALNLKAAFESCAIEPGLLNLVTRQSYSITSDERLLPSAATIAALVNKKQGIIQIDLGLEEMPPQTDKVELLGDFIAAELTVDQRSDVVAYRGRQRWTSKPTICSSHAQSHQGLQNGGHYLVIAEQHDAVAEMVRQISQSVVSPKVFVMGLWPDEQTWPNVDCYVQANSFNNGDLIEAMEQIKQNATVLNGIVYCPDNKAAFTTVVQTLLNIDELARNLPLEFCAIVMAQSKALSGKVSQIYTQAFVQNKHHFGSENWLYLVYQGRLDEHATLLQDFLQMERTSCLSFSA